MTSLNLQCVNCREVFTVDEVADHAKDEVCAEWSNHQMHEANFRVYTDEDEARDRAVAKSWSDFYASESDRARQLEDVRASGHLDLEGAELYTHLAEHGYGAGLFRWDADTAKDMHEHAHNEQITADWWKSYTESS